MTQAQMETMPGWSGINTSLGLLERVQARDEAAWQRLVALYAPLVNHWCRVARLAEQEWADVRQETFLAVSRKIGDFERHSRSGAFRAWLRVVTRSKIVDHWRRNQPEYPAGPGCVITDGLDGLPARNLEDDNPETEPGIVYRQALALIEGAFEPTTWRAFWLVVIDNQLPADAAAELGVTPNAVYLAKARVMRRLREEFADLLERGLDE